MSNPLLTPIPGIVRYSGAASDAPAVERPCIHYILDRRTIPAGPDTLIEESPDRIFLSPWGFNHGRLQVCGKEVLQGNTTFVKVNILDDALNVQQYIVDPLVADELFKMDGCDGWPVPGAEPLTPIPVRDHLAILWTGHEAKPPPRDEVEILTIILEALPFAPRQLPTPTGQTFLDIPPGHYLYEAVEYLAARGIISGYDVPGGGKEFRPGATVIRGHLASTLARALVQQGR